MRRQHLHLLLAAAAALALIGGCVYPPYDGGVDDPVEQQSVWQYLKVYSIFHERLPKTPGSMSPYDMFVAINDSLGGGRYTEYLDDRPGGGVMFDPDTKFDDPIELAPSSTVYFYLPEFSDVALEFFNANLRKLSKYPNIIIDVRDNGGGLLNVTDAILGELLPYNTQYIKNRYRRYNSGKYAGETAEDISRTSVRRPQLLDSDRRPKKIAVLMNGYSASASEILAAGLKDGADALLVGGKSYGKGIGQVIITRGDGRKRLSITFLEISGLTDRTGQYHKTGIEPDPVPKPIEDDVDAHIPNAKQRAAIQSEADRAVDTLRAKYPNIADSVIQKYRKNLVIAFEKWFREPYYALKQLDPGFAFQDDGDDDGDDGDDGDINGGGETAKRNMTAAVRNAKIMGGTAARIYNARAKWRPIGAVVVDGKDLPNIELPDD